MKRLGVCVVMLIACGGDGNTKQDAPKAIDASHDAPVDAHADAPVDGPPGTQQLTVKNYLSWCSVAVGSGSASIAATQQVFVQPGQVTLTATPRTGFEMDAHMWHHTDGDTSNTGEAGTQTGTATTGTSTATATVLSTAGKCVWVCCPFTGGAGCDPATIGEQCP